MGQPPQNDTQQVTAENLEQALTALDQNRPELIESAAAEPATKIVRDAFGNRQRIAVSPSTDDGPNDLKVQCEMYSLPKDLTRLVLSGKMDVATARTIRGRRSKSERRATLPTNMKVVIGLIAVVAIVVLVRLL